MIIAYGLFIISVFCSFLFLLGIFFEKLSSKNDNLNFIIWFIVCLCSAQYIWG